MAQITITRNTIPRVQQQVVIGDQIQRKLWCSSVSCQHGVGGTQAVIELPLHRADQIGDIFQDQKVIVNAALDGSGQMRNIFAGFLSSKSEDITETEDGVRLTAYSAGYYLTKRGVGEDGNYWHFKYPLIDEKTGTATGWTPLRVLLDLFTRLPAERLEHLQLGNLEALGTAYDIPTKVYDFSLANYRDAIESIAESMGNVAIREIFANGICYLDFFKIGDPAAAVNSVVVADPDSDTNPDANVGSISPIVTSDEAINKFQAFGRDREFMVTCKSFLTEGGAAEFSEPNPDVLPLPYTALEPDWDSDLSDMVIKDPKLANSPDGKVTRTAVMKPQQYANGKVNGQDDGDDAPAFPGTAALGPGFTDTEFWVDTGIHLVVNKTILIHAASGERMLVTAYTPWEDDEPADPENDPPIPHIAKKYATVTVTRLYQPVTGQTAGNLVWGEALAIEIPGIEHVYRRYSLPTCLQTYDPPIEIQSDIPVLDPETDERRRSQAFQYVTALIPHATDTNKKEGIWKPIPRLIDSFNIDKEKWNVTFAQPTVQPVLQTQTTVGSKKIIETTYEPTVVGLTFSYIDPHYTFGYDTGTYAGENLLPWVQSERERYDEMVFQQATNTSFPVPYTPTGATEPVNVVFNSTFINPDSGAITDGYFLVRSDIAYLQVLAFKGLGERFKRHVSYDIEIPWLDVGYAIGNRLVIRGLENQPRDPLTITGVTYAMPISGEHSTGITVDNARPPYRRRWSTKMQQSI